MRPPDQVARDLIGCGIVHRIGNQWVGGWIVETEAYLSIDDPASHSRKGISPRCRSMFAQGGTLYVYSIHAKYCMNIVTEDVGIGSAVLIRAIEPAWGVDRMRLLRGQDELSRLTRGPAMLCQSMGVDKSHDGVDLIDSLQWRVFRSTGPSDRREMTQPVQIGSSSRIGIREGVDLMLRFYERHNRFVSGTAKHRC